MTSYDLISGLFLILSQIAGIGGIFSIGEFWRILMVEWSAILGNLNSPNSDHRKMPISSAMS
jgi:hypothetical protein